MKEEQFIYNNSKLWKELESLSNVVNKKGIKSLSSKDVKRFLHLFRQSSHHLAYARTHYPKSSVVEYLNSLVGRCHNHIYAVKKVPSREFFKYISYGFPKLLKEYKWSIITSFSFFAIGLLLSLLLVLYNPDNAGLFLPANMAENIKGGKSGGGAWNYPLMSSYIMYNNISVSLKAIVFGITLGIGTIYVLFINGTVLGALTGIVYLYGDPVNYWSLILPHGIIELTAIFISGAAGLIIAKSILLPGEYTRGHSLIDGAKKAVSLIMGIIIMLVIAGIIEGFFTPLKISEASKLLFAALTGVVLTLYFAIPYLKQRKQKTSM